MIILKKDGRDIRYPAHTIMRVEYKQEEPQHLKVYSTVDKEPLETIGYDTIANHNKILSAGLKIEYLQ